jgi:U3 small nucleolar RNA-associated protein 10
MLIVLPRQVLSGANLALDSVTRTRSLVTTAKLQASLVAMIALIPRPTTIVLDWFKDYSPSRGSTPLGKDFHSDQDPVDTRCPRYIGLIRAVYEFANSITVPVLSHHLLRVLFINLKEDALAFLAGVLLISGSQNLRLPTLSYAIAFLDAHKFTPKQVDFQTILPALLAALSNLDVAGREAIMDCISILTKLSQAKPTSIYGFDSIYGSESGMLLFLVTARMIDVKYCRQAPIFRDERLPQIRRDS